MPRRVVLAHNPATDDGLWARYTETDAKFTSKVYDAFAKAEPINTTGECVEEETIKPPPRSTWMRR